MFKGQLGFNQSLIFLDIRGDPDDLLPQLLVVSANLLLDLLLVRQDLRQELVTHAMHLGAQRLHLGVQPVCDRHESR